MLSFIYFIILAKKNFFFRRDERRKKITHETFPSNRSFINVLPKLLFWRLYFISGLVKEFTKCVLSGHVKGSSNMRDTSLFFHLYWKPGSGTTFYIYFFLTISHARWPCQCFNFGFIWKYVIRNWNGKVCSIQHYVIKFVSDMRHVAGFYPVFRFPSPIKLTATIWLKTSLKIPKG